VLVDHALPIARDVGRADVVQALEPLRALAQLDHVARALDVDALRHIMWHSQVVDRREMEDRPHLGERSLVVPSTRPKRRSVMSPNRTSMRRSSISAAAARAASANLRSTSTTT
jgi:hypothetical protein